MGNIEMIYAASVGISLVALTVFGTVLWQRTEDRYKARKRARLQRLNNRELRHRQFEQNLKEYSEVIR